VLIQLTNAELITKQFRGAHKVVPFASIYYTTAVN